MQQQQQQQKKERKDAVPNIDVLNALGTGKTNEKVG